MTAKNRKGKSMRRSKERDDARALEDLAVLVDPEAPPKQSLVPFGAMERAFVIARKAHEENS